MKARKSPNMQCTDCGMLVSGRNGVAEYAYMLHRNLWRGITKYKPANKLCIGCVEVRLGRELVWTDFNWAVPLNDLPFHRSDRLLNRMQRRRRT